jgi:tryptophan halogenase
MPFDYGLTISVPVYIDSMRRHLIGAGVHFLASEHVHPSMSANGHIGSVAVDLGTVEADFFIDASETGVLAQGDETTGRFLDVLSGYEAVIASASTMAPAIDALNRSTLMSSGHIEDLGTRTGRWLNFIHDSTKVSEDDLAVALPSRADIRLRPLRQGRIDACWRGNCVAIGPAAGTLEPFGGFEVARIQVGLAQLLALFPDRRLFPSLARTYNRVVADIFDCQKDAVLALHATSGRLLPSDWPDSLRLRIEQFQSRGRVVLLPEDTLEEADWASLLWGLGVTPERYDPLIDSFDPRKIMARMREAHRAVDDIVGQAPFVRQEANL